MNPMYSIVPSNEALSLIKDHLPNGDRCLAMARTGSHNFNPYHNLTHELGVAYWAYSCFMNQEGGSPEDHEISGYAVPKLIMGSLFHDHGHSGGRETDDINVQRAVEFFLSAFDNEDLVTYFGDKWSEIQTAMDSTMFVGGKFPNEPTTFIAKCIRDADLMSIYSAEGRQLLMGLLTEMNIRVNSFTKADEVVCQQMKFLASAKMYTSYGKYMQRHYLHDALTEFHSDLYQVAATRSSNLDLAADRVRTKDTATLLWDFATKEGIALAFDSTTKRITFGNDHTFDPGRVHLTDTIYEAPGVSIHNSKARI